MTVRMTVQNWNKLSHVTNISATPSLFGIGGNKEDTPERNQKEVKGGTAYRGTGSTASSVAHNSTNCKKKYAAGQWGSVRKKSPAQTAGDVDKYPQMGYSISTRGTTSRRFPQVLQRSNRLLGGVAVTSLYLSSGRQQEWQSEWPYKTETNCPM